MKLIQIVERATDECHAGGKAPRDVCDIAERVGFERLEVCRGVSRVGIIHRLLSFWWVIKSYFYCIRVSRGSIILVQFPASYLRGRLGYRFIECLRRLRSARIITVVHDVDVLRYGSQDVQSADFIKSISKLSDVMIVHNQRMADWFVSQGFLYSKLVLLGIFDYLTDTRMPSAPRDFRTVMVAGNLDADKTGYLAGLKDVADVRWLLYGPSYDAGICGGGNIDYMGCYPADELPMRLNGGFGLVWDGDSVDTCAGGYGEYLRYNNPHKLSLYLASGIPVIIWKDAAEAELVLKAGIGIAVMTLRDVGSAIETVSSDEYVRMRTAARLYGERLRMGGMLTSALKNALEILGS